MLRIIYSLFFDWQDSDLLVLFLSQVIMMSNFKFVNSMGLESSHQILLQVLPPSLEEV